MAENETEAKPVLPKATHYATRAKQEGGATVLTNFVKRANGGVEGFISEIRYKGGRGEENAVRNLRPEEIDVKDDEWKEIKLPDQS